MRHDFKKVRERYPLVDVCKLLGIKLKKVGQKYEGKCPICYRNAFKVTPGKELWWCFQHSRTTGDAIQLVKDVKRFDKMTEAAEFIVKGLGR